MNGQAARSTVAQVVYLWPPIGTIPSRIQNRIACAGRHLPNVKARHPVERAARPFKQTSGTFYCSTSRLPVDGRRSGSAGVAN